MAGGSEGDSYTMWFGLAMVGLGWLICWSWLGTGGGGQDRLALAGLAGLVGMAGQDGLTGLADWTGWLGLPTIQLIHLGFGVFVNNNIIKTRKPILAENHRFFSVC